MNAQTSGPLFVGIGDRIQTQAAPWNGRILADMTHTDTRDTTAEARLFASAYTAFDKAGRELGIDAATLAEGLDLASLIRAACEAEQAMGKMRQGAFRFACARLNAALVNVESGTVASQ